MRLFLLLLVLISVTSYAERNPYNVLGLPQGASENLVRNRFKELVRQLHPDINKKSTDEARLKCEEQLKEVLAAYEILKKQFATGSSNGGFRENFLRRHLKPYYIPPMFNVPQEDIITILEKLYPLFRQLEEQMDSDNFMEAKKTVYQIYSICPGCENYVEISFLRSFKSGTSLRPDQVEFLLHFYRDWNRDYISTLLRGYSVEGSNSQREFADGLVGRTDYNGLLPLVLPALRLEILKPNRAQLEHYYRVSGLIIDELMKDISNFRRHFFPILLEKEYGLLRNNLFTKVARQYATNRQDDNLRFMFDTLNEQFKRIEFEMLVPFIFAWRDHLWTWDELKPLFGKSTLPNDWDFLMFEVSFLKEDTLKFLKAFAQERSDVEILRLRKTIREGFRALLLEPKLELEKALLNQLPKINDRCEGALIGAQFEFDFGSDQGELF